MKRWLWLLLALVTVVSCARVGSPVGGVRDTIPPRVTGTNIDSPRINVPRDIRELRIDFDEYITLKEINRQLVISPPIERITKILPAGLANKYLLIRWNDTLQANTTYNFNFGNAIVDNNENNPLAYYNFAFSTGPAIDSLYISGEAVRLFPEKAASAEKKGIVIGLYQEKDSMNFRQKPYYLTKADDDGYFELNYLSPGTYRLLAFEDENANSVYDAEKEAVAFLKEPIELTKSISGLPLQLAPSRKSVKYLEMKEAPGGILMTFQGRPDSISVAPLNPKLKDYKITHRKNSDSAHIWFDAERQQIGTEISENLRFRVTAGNKSDTVSTAYRYNTKNEMTLANSGGNLLAPGRKLVLTSNYYIEKITPEKWTLVSDSIAQNFQAEITDDGFGITVTSAFKEGQKYQLTVPKETVASFYESIAKSYRFDFTADKTESYGDFLLTLKNKPEHPFWVELVRDNGEVAYSVYGTQETINFKTLKPGKYQLRILVDTNENRLWDAADFGTLTFAEPVYLFEKTVEVRPLWEIRETWDLNSKNAQLTPKEETAGAQQPPLNEEKKK